jgi:hypothetical protein
MKMRVLVWRRIGKCILLFKEILLYQKKLIKNKKLYVQLMMEI